MQCPACKSKKVREYDKTHWQCKHCSWIWNKALKIEEEKK